MLNYMEENQIVTLSMNDGKANAVSHAFVDDMNKALDQAAGSAKAIIIEGMPGKFSAGFDLEEFKKGPEATSALVNKGGRMLHRIFTLPQPVIAAVTGHAIAAGAFMLLAADVRVGVDGQYKIGANESAIGMTLPRFASELIEYRVPRHHIDQVAIGAHLYGPKEAMAKGFIDEVVPAEQLAERTKAIAEQLAGYPGGGYAGNKHLFRAEYADRILASLG